MCLFICCNFDINSVLLFKTLFWLAHAIINFSVRQRSYLLVPQVHGVAYAVILHFTLNSIPLRFNCQICFKSSVFVFIILIPKRICVIVVPILELSIGCAIIYVCFILFDNTSSVNNARFQATASKWTIVFISAIA